MSAIDGQLSIFDELPEPETKGYRARPLSEVERLTYGLSAIHTSMSWLYDLIGNLQHKGGPDSSRSPGAVAGMWAYAEGKKGLWFEPYDQWATTGADGTRNPWESQPAYCLEWDEIRDLIGDRPERIEFVEWAHELEHPASMWRFHRPWELHARREYLTDEQLAEGWTYAQEPTDPDVLDRWERMLSMFPKVIEEIGGKDIPVAVPFVRRLVIDCPCGATVNSYTYATRHEGRCAGAERIP